jgi:hypothetical protein
MRRLLGFAFLLWLILVNFFYYAQFKALFLSRFGAFIHRWVS